MKKFAMLILAAAFVLGWTKPAQQTTPVDGEKQERSVDSPPPPVDQDDNVKNEEPAEPKVTGYGHDPGEETQE